MTTANQASLVGVSSGALVTMGAEVVKWLSAMVESASWVPVPDPVATFLSVTLVVPLVMLWQSAIKREPDKQ